MLKVMRRIKMAGQMQRSQQRRINFCSARPETSRLIVHQIKGTALPGTRANELHGSILMLAVPALKVIWLGTRIAGREEFSSNVRSGGGGNRSRNAASRHF